MNTANGLFVKSHVARDLLQNAALFKTDKLVVWEYVSNGLQYVGPGTNPLVKVSLDSKKKRISVQDNGRGMDWNGLRNFFVMPGGAPRSWSLRDRQIGSLWNCGSATDHNSPTWKEIEGRVEAVEHCDHDVGRSNPGRYPGERVGHLLRERYTS